MTIINKLKNVWIADNTDLTGNVSMINEGKSIFNGDVVQKDLTIIQKQNIATSNNNNDIKMFFTTDTNKLCMKFMRSDTGEIGYFGCDTYNTKLLTNQISVINNTTFNTNYLFNYIYGSTHLGKENGVFINRTGDLYINPTTVGGDGSINNLLLCFSFITKFDLIPI